MSLKEFIAGALNKPEPGDKIQYFDLKHKVSGYILTNAQNSMPAAGYTYDADLTDFFAEFEKLKAECGYHLTFNSVLMRVLVEGLKAAPRLNAHIEYNNLTTCGRLIIKKHINVAMPIIMESGQTFPLKVNHIEDKSLREISEQIDDLMERYEKTDVDKVLSDMIAQRLVGFMLKGKIVSTLAQVIPAFIGKGKVASLAGLGEHAPTDGSWLRTNELNEGTVCLSNLGPLRSDLDGFVAYGPLLYPQVFLMTVGSVHDKAVPFKNEDGVVDIATKKVLPITLMFDHRLGGFNDILPFIERINEVFANPKLLREW